MTEKSNDNKVYWNKVYKEIGNVKPVYDLWLDRYKEIFDKGRDGRIIDLGCGSGNDSIYLEERNYSVISCDYSKEALHIVSRYMKNPDLVEIDMTEGLPFESDSAEVIIADLSLHYFDDMTTKYVLNEIKRVLKCRGYLIARVNSVNDINYNAGCGEEFERHFYLTKDGFKRFFDEVDIRKYFGVFNIQSMKETVMKRYGMDKKCFEVVCLKDR